MNIICGDNRFEIIAKAKAHLLDATNIDTSPKEMEVLDSFLFRCWQMGWLDRYDEQTEPQAEVLTQLHEMFSEMEKLLRKSSAEIVGAIREQGERKKGTYRDSDEEDEWYCYYYICNECGEQWMGSANYCPGCGAELKGENDEDTDRQKI